MRNVGEGCAGDGACAGMDRGPWMNRGAGENQGLWMGPGLRKDLGLGPNPNLGTAPESSLLLRRGEGIRMDGVTSLPGPALRESDISWLRGPA